MTDIPHMEHDTSVLNGIGLFQWTAQETPIRFFGDHILHTPCEPVAEHEFGTPELQAIASGLIAVLTKFREHAAIGRGLADNQVIRPGQETCGKQIIAVWFESGPKVLINPKVIEAHGMGSYYEACLSSGAFLLGEVHRPWQAAFAYRDVEGAHHTLNADEFETRVTLHEKDHLDGKVCNELYEPGTIRFVRGGRPEIMNYQLRQLEE
jgi:peptide deformylase